MSVPIRYTFSFTGASALVAETLIVADEFCKLNSWRAVEQSLLANNLLNKIKQTTFKREFFEIKKRLSMLTPAELSIMSTSGADDAKCMILLSLVKTYSYFHEFIVEIIRTKYLLYDPILSEADYNKFYETKSLTHPELASLSTSTSNKVRQVIFKFLTQVGIVTNEPKAVIVKPILSKNALRTILQDNPLYLKDFLYSGDEIKALLQNHNNV